MIPAPYDDPQTVATPAWWLKRLDKAMRDRQPALETLDNYYSGRHKLAFATEKFRERFGNLFGAFADNWCELVVDAVEERLNVEGFRIPVDPSDVQEGQNAGAQADTAAWDIWQANNLDALSQICHTEALINGEASVLVWWDEDGDDAQITIEHPQQMIPETDPANPMKVRAALKKWVDDTEYVFATLYLPDGIFKFQSQGKARNVNGVPRVPAQITWEQREVPGEQWPLPNPLGVVPVVPFRNKPRLLTPAVSEIKTVIPKQDGINKLCADMMIASEFQSFRQRFITGLELPRDPETDEPIMPYKQALERVWFLEASSDGKSVPQVGELGQVDLSGYVKAIELFVQHVASQTRTPPHYFYLTGQFPSGESIKSAETGLVAKTRRKMRFFGEAWEAVIRMAFAVQGDTARAEVTTSETIWADPESRSESQHVDAVMKMLRVGIPEEALWEELGFSPQQIERFKQMRAAEAALNPGLGSVPTVFDPVLQKMVQVRDPNLRYEAPVGTPEEPRLAEGALGQGNGRP